MNVVEGNLILVLLCNMKDLRPSRLTSLHVYSQNHRNITVYFCGSGAADEDKDVLEPVLLRSCSRIWFGGQPVRRSWSLEKAPVLTVDYREHLPNTSD